MPVDLSKCAGLSQEEAWAKRLELIEQNLKKQIKVGKCKFMNNSLYGDSYQIDDVWGFDVEWDEVKIYFKRQSVSWHPEQGGIETVYLPLVLSLSELEGFIDLIKRKV